MGVCCIVFDIDGMLFEFFMNFLNIEIFFLLVKWGRWFLQIVDIHVGNLNMKLTGRWFPQIVDRDSGNLYPIYIKQKLWCWFLNLSAGDIGRASCLVFIVWTLLERVTRSNIFSHIKIYLIKSRNLICQTWPRNFVLVLS